MTKDSRGRNRSGAVRAAGRHGIRASMVGAVLVGAAVVATSTACGVDLRDRECTSNEYPVQAVGPEGGGQCVTKGKEPPAGTVRYPKGQEPKRVGDKWDLYWQDHGLDANGKLIKK
ncbi:SCO0607 family lipoprotein [Streptomyces sp. NBC_00448]|uniref:SCO0607 family lipoprotein n=1 Tax=Streptomyces sp. NBC_00448 TaxID=2903652 RepID=UPI002E23B84E